MGFDPLSHSSVDQRRQRFSALNKVGLIFLAYNKAAKNKKFMVVIGVSQDTVWTGNVLINSKINRLIAKSIHLQNLHLKISASDYPFLVRDSYIDCTKIHELEYKRVENMFINGVGKYKGQLIQLYLIHTKA